MLQRGTWISRLSAIAILVLVVLAAHRFLVMPLVDRHLANGERIQEMSDLLQRYRSLEAAKPALLDRLAAMRALDEGADGYWVGVSDVVTAARLRDRAAEAVEDHDGDVVSMQALDQADPEEASAIGRMALGMRLATTVEGLARTLQDIETATPYILIDRLIINPQRSRQRAGGEDGDLTRKTLDVRLDLSAYARKRESASEDGAPPVDEEG